MHGKRIKQQINYSHKHLILLTITVHIRRVTTITINQAIITDLTLLAIIAKKKATGLPIVQRRRLTNSRHSAAPLIIIILRTAAILVGRKVTTPMCVPLRIRRSSVTI
jgi:hypothetical protein